MLKILMAFFEGLSMIISPCILSILPITLAAGVDGSHKRAYGITAGFIATFSAFTLLSRELVVMLHVDLNIIRIIACYILVFFGLSLIFERLFSKIASASTVLVRIGTKLGQYGAAEGGFRGGIMLGATLGLVWTPCAGPILAAVLIQVIQGQTTWEGLVVILSFSIGAAIPMLGIILAGQQTIAHLNFLKRYSALLRRLLGMVIIASVFYVGGADLVGWHPVVKEEVVDSVIIQEEDTTIHVPLELKQGLPTAYPAPELGKVGPWLNTKPLKLSELKGKVVLIDFWTYSCVNCVRSLPHLRDWHNKYKDKGLVIIGVHAPEFEFEKSVENVQAAVSNHGIEYPVAQDNHFVAWKAYRNQYWPAHYLINKDGEVVYTHFGEGNYDITENNIRYLLGLGGAAPIQLESPPFHELQTPETYLGLARAQGFSSPEASKPGRVGQFTLPDELSKDHWGLQGAWRMTEEFVEAQEEGSTLALNFSAKKVYLVMSPGTSQQPVMVALKLNGEPIAMDGGKDVIDGKIEVAKDDLYELVDLPEFMSGTLEITAETPGLRAYAFTFGG